jgi:hypothetical protein
MTLPAIFTRPMHVLDSSPRHLDGFAPEVNPDELPKPTASRMTFACSELLHFFFELAEFGF